MWLTTIRIGVEPPFGLVTHLVVDTFWHRRNCPITRLNTTLVVLGVLGHFKSVHISGLGCVVVVPSEG